MLCCRGLKGLLMKNAIRNQLMITYILMTIIPVMVISIYIVNVYSQSIIEVEQSVLERSFEQIDSNMVAEMEGYFYTLGFLVKDRQIRMMGMKSLQDRTDVQMLLQGYMRQSPFILSITVFDNEGNYVSSDEKGHIKQSFLSSPQMEQMVEGEILLTHYSPGNSPIISDNSEYIDTLHMFTSYGQDSDLYVNVMVSSMMFEEAVKNVDLGDGGYFYITSNQDTLVYSPVASNQLDKQDDKRYLTKVDSIEGTDWNLHTVRPIVAVLERINVLRNNLITLFLVTIIILIVITTFFSGYIVKPIKKLQYLMGQVEKGNLDVMYEEKVNNEVHDLGIGFNKMLSKIRDLIKQVKKEQQSKKATEIAMLQSNIKPHFLYNTLETIRWMSKKYRADDIGETVDALATFFRVGLSKGKDMISLEEELSHVGSYLQIQRLRYEDIMDYDIEVDDKLKFILVPKLILQPFVENALYHGIKESGDEGHIRIKAIREQYYENGSAGNSTMNTAEDTNVNTPEKGVASISEEHLLLTVTDTGQGMSRDRLNELISEMSSHKDRSYISYGVKNVHNRIRLMFGEPYGVEIRSTEGMGTTVLIRLPMS